jgi:hypothetical protein
VAPPADGVRGEETAKAASFAHHAFRRQVLEPAGHHHDKSVNLIYIMYFER